jgi:CheY-like chemotaxis protein
MSSGSIISVEDSDTDFLALQHALQAAGVTNRVQRCESGRAAVGYLLSDENAPLAAKASLIMLDLNLPGVDGRELLRKMRARDPMRAVPIIVLSTSSHPKDIDNCYRAGADAYMVKPLELEDWETKVGQLAQSWLKPHEGGEVMRRNSSCGELAPLGRIIETEIIPRLLLAHSQPLGAREEAAASVDFIAGEDEVAELTRLLLTQDIGVVTTYVETMRCQGATLGSLYLTLLAPAAQLVGDWWRADRCSFTDVSLALSRLQNLLRDLSPPLPGERKH